MQPGDADASPATVATLLNRLITQQVVLLGEIHGQADNHRWQLDVLTALHERRPDIAIGFEMFPRRVQPVLDRWVAGELSEAEFLNQVDWKAVWSYNPQFYLPLFHFARQHRLPMLALNVDRSLVQQVSTHGWDAVPEAQRQGVGRPFPPDKRYLNALQMVFDGHNDLKKNTGRFDYFVEAQTLWDRAMAEGIAGHLQNHPQRLVVGILGEGHVRNGYGVPHQLKAFEVTRQSSLLTLPSDRSCATLPADLADAVFVIPPQSQIASSRPRLGVRLVMAENDVLIDDVRAGSLAEQTGLKAGDVVVQAAGRNLSSIEEMILVVQRQPAGTWLPLQIRRGKDMLDMVVRFPVQP
ncbi:MAG: ChaN family lipoprotein [Gallionella sp.]|nr:ChaN family lipoprotein [Gallionella sp.]